MIRSRARSRAARSLPIARASDRASRTSDRYSDFRTRSAAARRKEASAWAAECSRPSNCEQSVIERLHAEADPVDAVLAQEPRLAFRNAARIRLQGPFAQLPTNPVARENRRARKSSCAVVRAVGVPPPKKIVSGAASIGARCPVIAVTRTLQTSVPSARAQLRQNRLAKPRGLRRIGSLFVKCAVGTNARAKRDVHIDVPPRAARCRGVVNRPLAHRVHHRRSPLSLNRFSGRQRRVRNRFARRPGRFRPGPAAARAPSRTDALRRLSGAQCGGDPRLSRPTQRSSGG